MGKENTTMAYAFNDCSIVRKRSGSQPGIVYPETVVCSISWYGSIPEDVQSLKKDPSIAYVEEDVEVKIANQTTPWGITRVQAPTALNRGFTGSGVRPQP